MAGAAKGANRMPKIFIDPGHGGSDPGAVGNGMRESDIVLDVSKRIAVLLLDSGIEINLSRTTDTSLSLSQRWQPVNRAGADLFISVHANGFHDPAANGCETFIAVTKPGDRDFAQTSQSALVSATGLRDRGVRPDNQSQHSGLTVLRRTEMPAILVELAFITARPDSRDIQVLKYKRQLVAKTIAKAIIGYLNVKEGLEVRFNRIDEMPGWAQETMRRLIVDKGLIRGNGQHDENGVPIDLNLSEDMIRMFIINDRAGLYVM